MSADRDRGEETLAERLRGLRPEGSVEEPLAPDVPAGDDSPAPQPDATPSPPAKRPARKKARAETTEPKRKPGRPRTRVRSVAEAKAPGGDPKARSREWARTLRAMDLLVVHGHAGAVEALRLETGSKALALRAVDHAERYLAEHRHEPGRGESRAVYRARMAYLFHASLDADDLRNARHVARDLALVDGVLLSDEQAPGTAVASGLDVSDLTDEERGSMRELLDSVRRRIAGGGGR